MIPAIGISTHAPLAGCDMQPGSLLEKDSQFLPTHPLRGATTDRQQALTDIEFLPTHPLRGATEEDVAPEEIDFISTHAPLAGCDARLAGVMVASISISTHAPLAGCDF